jgi:hypothetical protein
VVATAVLKATAQMLVMRAQVVAMKVDLDILATAARVAAVMAVMVVLLAMTKQTDL